MASERDNADERQARIEAMIDQFREAQQRRIVQRGIAAWKRAEATQMAMACGPRLPLEKIHSLD